MVSEIETQERTAETPETTEGPINPAASVEETGGQGGAEEQPSDQ